MTSHNNLLAEHLNQVRAIVLSFAPPAAMLDDLLQEAAIVTIEAVTGWGPKKKGTLGGYIHCEIRRMILEQIRANRHLILIKDKRYWSNPSEATRRVLEARRVDEGGIPDPCNGGHTRVDNALDACFLLDLLTGRPRFVVEQYIHGRTFGEIGKDLGVAKERARSIYRRGIAKLKRYVKEKTP